MQSLQGCPYILMDYAPESKSVLKISRESLNGMENRFSWGQAVRAEYIEDKKMWQCMERTKRIYREFQQDMDVPEDAYCVRIKITHDEEENDWNS